MIMPDYAPKIFQDVEGNCGSAEGPAQELLTSEITVVHCQVQVSDNSILHDTRRREPWELFSVLKKQASPLAVVPTGCPDLLWKVKTGSTMAAVAPLSCWYIIVLCWSHSSSLH